MKVALYHPWVYLRSGVERWMLEVIERSRHDWVVYTHHYDPAGTYPEVSLLPVTELSPRISVRRSMGPLLQAASTIARTSLPDDGTRAVLVSSEGFGDLATLRARIPALAYCHTPLKILHDPAASALVRAHSPARRLAMATVGPGFEAVDRLAWRRYRHVFVNSTETLARVEKAGLRPSGPVEVLEPAVSEAWFPAQLSGARDAVFLYAGRLMWQKNIELAIDALRLLGGGSRLIIAGTVDEKSRGYVADLRARAAGLPVTFEICPSDDRLRELYSLATALLFTPRNEDFGMVVLEAMAAGTPVLAVDAGGPRSTVAHGVTGWLLEPEASVFAKQMASVVADPPGQAVREAAQRAARARSWRAHVDRLDDVVEQVIRAG